MRNSIANKQKANRNQFKTILRRRNCYLVYTKQTNFLRPNSNLTAGEVSIEKENIYTNTFEKISTAHNA